MQRGQQDQRVIQVLLGLLVPLVQQAQPDQRALRVQRGQLATKVILVLQGRQGQRGLLLLLQDRQGLLDLQARPDQLGLPDLRGRPARRATQAPPDQQVLLALPLLLLARQVQQARLVHLDRLARLALQVQQGQRAEQALQVRQVRQAQPALHLRLLAQRVQLVRQAYRQICFFIKQTQP